MKRGNMIPVHIITGFLGSGKTTVLNYMLKSPQFSRAIVIINEFGEVGLDHLLVSSADENIIEMSSGCICCTIRGDLKKKFRDIKGRFFFTGKRKFDRVIIETTGLADPAPIIHTIMTDPKLTDDYEIKSVIATIDSTCFTQTENTCSEARKQAAMADCLLLTKADLVEPEKIGEINSLIRTINPSAPLHIAKKGVVDIDAVFTSPDFSTTGKKADVEKWLNEEAYSGEHECCHQHGHHEHDVSRHGDDISAFCITRDLPVDKKAFMVWIELIMKMMGSRMLRIKGIINIDGYSGPVVIHGVQHIFYPLYNMEQWPDSDHRTRIVFITKGLKKEFLGKSLQSLNVSYEKQQQEK
jgi:G3E family GTPase